MPTGKKWPYVLVEFNTELDSHSDSWRVVRVSDGRTQVEVKAGVDALGNSQWGDAGTPVPDGIVDLSDKYAWFDRFVSQVFEAGVRHAQENSE